MSSSKQKRFTRGWPSGVALLIANSAAFADTTKLICQMTPDMPWTEQGPTTVELNEASGTVTVNYAPTQSSFGSGPGGVVGPLSAVFGPDTITFTNPNTVMFGGSYVINRLTGMMIEPSANWKWNCHLGQKQF